MSDTVRSLRIGSDSYRIEGSETEVVHIVSDQRLLDLEEENRRLRMELIKTGFKIRHSAKQETEKRIKEAIITGTESGRNEGIQIGRASIEEAAILIRKLAEEIETSLDTVWKDCREIVVNLTMDIARKLVGTIAEDYSGLAGDLTSRCIRQVRDQMKVIIAANPDDVAQLREAQVELKSLVEGVKEIEVVERKSVGRGGVVIETDSGQLDARIEEQLEVIDAALRPDWSKPNGNNGNGESVTDESNSGGLE